MNQLDLDNECARTESALEDARKRYSEARWGLAGGTVVTGLIWSTYGLFVASGAVAWVLGYVVYALVMRRRVSAALDLHYRATAALERHVGAEREKLMGRVAAHEAFKANGAINPRDAA